MITALSVKIPKEPKGLQKIFRKFRRDRVELTIKRSRGVSLKHIIYTSFSGKIKLEKIDTLIGNQRSKLLCDTKLAFSEKSGYQRFYSNEFSERLCTNMAMAVIKDCKNAENISVGVYDPDGDSHDILFGILQYCSDVRVVTNDNNSYQYELDRIMDELGASAVITSNIEELSNCSLIIAPCVIEEDLPIKGDTLVLTAGIPKPQMSGIIYYKYQIRMPKGFDSLKPFELDAEYFCSALYTLAKQYELGSIIPNLCSNFSSSQTVKSLSDYINRNA